MFDQIDRDKKNQERWGIAVINYWGKKDARE
jgi:hypothetical protein